MIGRLGWRLLEDVPVVLVVIAVLYLVGVDIERNTQTGIYFLLIGLASATVIGFFKGVLDGMKSHANHPRN